MQPNVLSPYLNHRVLLKLPCKPQSDSRMATMGKRVSHDACCAGRGGALGGVLYDLIGRVEEEDRSSMYAGSVVGG